MIPKMAAHALVVDTRWTYGRSTEDLGTVLIRKIGTTLVLLNRQGSETLVKTRYICSEYDPQ